MGNHALAQDPDLAAAFIGGDASTELSANRTALSFDRTALSSDRTLMAGVRTSLALIGFGFTIFQFFHTLNTKYAGGALPANAPRRFGFALIMLGVVMLSVGILNHWHETKARRARRQSLVERNLLHGPEAKKLNSATVVAVLLLIVGLLAVLSVVARVGPF